MSGLWSIGSALGCRIEFPKSQHVGYKDGWILGGAPPVSGVHRLSDIERPPPPDLNEWHNTVTQTHTGGEAVDSELLLANECIRHKINHSCSYPLALPGGSV